MAASAGGTRAGAETLFLPPCSPDLNPVEMALATLKTSFRKAVERTAEGARRTVGTFLDRLTPEECMNCLNHAGYGSAQVKPSSWAA